MYNVYIKCNDVVFTISSMVFYEVALICQTVLFSVLFPVLLCIFRVIVNAR